MHVFDQWNATLGVPFDTLQNLSRRTLARIRLGLRQAGWCGEEMLDSLANTEECGSGTV